MVSHKIWVDCFYYGFYLPSEKLPAFQASLRSKEHNTRYYGTTSHCTSNPLTIRRNVSRLHSLDLQARADAAELDDTLNFLEENSDLDEMAAESMPLRGDDGKLWRYAKCLCCRCRSWRCKSRQTFI